MDIVARVNRGILTLKINEGLHLHNSQDFKYIFDSMIDKNLKVVLDFSNINYIDEIGVACLHYCQEKSYQYSSRMFLYRPVGKVKKVLQITNSYDFFDIVDHLELNLFDEVEIEKTQDDSYKEVA
jgi:anti-anti-sigma factor